MTGKGRELADMMERRKVDILCVQETRWKGSKARSIGAGFKLFYYGVDSKRNGVGVVLKEEFVRNVLEVKRVSDRVMSLKLEIEGVMLNVVSGYAPQVGCELEEKERFWSELDEVMESIPTGERVVIGADFNGHVGEGNTGDEEVMGKFGVKERNLEGQMVVDFAKRMDMGVVNTYFQKREEHRVTYKSGGKSTQVDYILCRRGNLKEISDCKVVVGESVARQHRMVVCRMTLMVCKKKRSEIEKKTKWWKLKKEECCEEFRQKLRQALGGQVVLPDDWETTAEVIRETGRKVLGVSSGRRKEDKETWWWNEEVQDSIQRKRLAKKKWDMDRTEENRQEYKELQRRVKREVSKAKQKAYDELYTRLDTREGEKDLYKLARQRDRDGKDVQQVRVIKDRDGRVLTSEESVQRRWKEYFEELMNEENEREKRVEGVNSVEQKVDKIRKDEVRKALKRMKSGKAVGPDDIPVEVWKCLGEAAVEFLTSLFNRVLESERMPEEWRRSVLVPIFKNKGDVQSCSNYRGIKLMSHTMKLWERVVEARLRKVVEICEQQYGFMPRKSTTDAIFALRILMEKYRDGQRELHCVFVDLEKAYDRVPREELWYCMRKSGVAEKYVRVVQDMYERSRTVVRCAVGQTEEFNVEVGLHQGSALSPFLFAIVMDQLSEEVRQESPWTMMFADDIVICSESREQVEENLERWRFMLERRGMKVSRSKTEYMCVNEREGSGTVRLQGEEVKKVQEFKYLGSTVQSNGECGKEVKKRVQAGWNGWRKVSGVLCDRKISARIKGKLYRTVVRPAMLYGLETVSLRKRQESELEVAELKMLRFSLGVTRLDRIRNEYIRGTAHVGRLGDKLREARLRWFGHVQRRESEYIGRRMLDMELPGRRQRGRPKRRYMDGINEDMKLVGASVEDAEDRDRWREMIRCCVEVTASKKDAQMAQEPNRAADDEELSMSEEEEEEGLEQENVEGADQDKGGDEEKEQEEEDAEEIDDVTEDKKTTGKKCVPGIVYLGHIPPRIRPKHVRNMLAVYGEIGRIFLQSEDRSVKRKKRKAGNRGSRYVEGWVEFRNKHVAKRVAASLHNTPMTNRKRSHLSSDLWCIKYLHRFQWCHLSERLAYERTVYQQRMRTEISQAKRETNFYLASVEKSQTLDRLRKKRAKKGEVVEEKGWDFTQRRTEEEMRLERMKKSGLSKKNLQKAQEKSRAIQEKAQSNVSLLAKIFNRGASHD
ncbi:hypothetical protein QTP86_023364 [Hemibagrus guttatus]|nr:hypothetical protein QTP86_023364 [Hemibagrus guttatus]